MNPPPLEGYALSPHQERAWRRARTRAQGDGVRAAVDICGPLQPRLLQQAFDNIVRRHEILRTELVCPAGLETPLQVIASSHAPVVCASVEGAADEVQDRNARVRGLLQQLDFPLGLPPIRAELASFDATHHALLLALPGTHADAATLHAIVAELAAEYAATSGSGASVPVPAGSAQYADVAEWQLGCVQSDDHASDRAYWANLAADEADLDVVPTRIREGDVDVVARSVDITIEAELCRAISDTANAHGAPPADLFQAAWLALLWRLGGIRTVSVLHDGRRHEQLRGVLGPLSNYLPQGHTIDAHSTLAVLLREISRANAEARLREEFYVWRAAAGARPGIAFEFCDCSSPFAAGRIRMEIQRLEASLDTFDLKLSVTAHANGFSADLWYDGATRTRESVEAIARGFVAMLSAFVSRSEPSVGACPAIESADSARELEWARGEERIRETAGERRQSVDQWFETQAATVPNQPALVWNGGSVTYGELEVRANQLASLLRRKGAAPGRNVAIVLQHLPNVPVALLATLKAGAAYVPLDPALPKQRFEALLDQARVAIVLTDQDEQATGAASDRAVVDVSRIDLASENADAVGCDVSADELAYVMYTSGSTGAPKGVMVTRENLLHSTCARLQYYGMPARFVLLSPYTFDSSAAGLYATLCGGGTLLLPSNEERQNPADLNAFIERHGATDLLLVPSLYTTLLATSFAESPPQSLERVIVAGEVCPSDLVIRHRAALPGTRLFNEYGPTEGTVWATVARVDEPFDEPEHPRSASIGRPIPASQVLLFDSCFHPVLPGAAGEIFIGGGGVARGYAGQSGQTAASFVPNPFEPGGRLYRTGDFARRAADGSLEFLGRRDDQLKINGYRIEPSEIEAALRRTPGVKAAAVVGVTMSDGSRGLTACVESDAAVTPHALKDALRQELPPHMVPTGFTIVRALPRTRTGKIDRAACAALGRDERRSRSRPPETQLEIRLSDIWRELLGIDSIGVEDDFFTLGGHSLLAIRLLARVRDVIGCEIKLHELFDKPTIAGLAARIERSHGRDDTSFDLKEVVADLAARHEPFPLNSIQEAYWVGRKEGFELGNVGSTNYFEFGVPDLDLDRFTTALRRLIDRHDMLRATIHPDGVQQVAQTVPPYVIRTIDVRDVTPEERDRSLDAVRQRMSSESLSTARWPLFEIVAHQLPNATRLHIATELVVCDAVSSRILLRDLYRLYHEPDVELPPLEIGFRDYVLAERALRNSSRFERAKAYWQSKLASLPPAPELPLAKDPRQIASPHFSTLKHELSEETWMHIKRRAAEAAVTPTAVLCATYAGVLSLWTKSPQFTLNLTTYSRLPFHRQVHELVGDFTSLTMIEVDCAAGSFTDHARRIQQGIWQNLDRSEFGGVDVMRELRRLHGNASRALMPVVFTSQLGTTSRDDPAARQWLGTLVYSSGQAPQVWIDHQVAEPDGRLQFWWDYLEELFPDGLVQQIFGCYCSALERLACDDESWTRTSREPWRASPPVLLPGQPSRVAVVDVSGFAGGVLHGGFLRQMEERSGAAAVVWEGEDGQRRQLTYAGVGAWAWRVAEAVGGARAGCAAGEAAVVTVALPKGWEQVAAVLGVSWAGASYVPVDVSWPAARVQEIVRQTGCRLVIGTRAERARVGESGAAWVCIDEWVGHGEPEQAAGEWRGASAEWGVGPARPADLAYVIYTSGSTGTPKGVMIEHGAACRTVAEVVRRWGVGPSDRVLALSALSFDLSVFDVFGVLAAGGTIVLPTQRQRRDAAAWVRLAGTQGVTVWNSVPALLQLAVEVVETRGGGWRGPLRLALLSGDWIPVSLPGRLRAVAPRAAVVSLGGATEAAIWSIAYDVEDADAAAQWRSIPYGRALAGQTVQVLRGEERDDGRDLTPCPPWVTGRIFIGGGGLARGYWDNAEETQRRFVRHPQTGERLYETGDLGRYLPDGTIELLGRVDHQVKIQGYRVELGEIEATLTRHPDLAAATARVFDTPAGTKQLVAYIVPRIGVTAIDLPALRRFLFEHLPAYMIPMLEVLPSLPLNANDKVDVSALPPPVIVSAEAYAAADEPRLAVLQRVAAEVLNVSLGPDDNLLELGANSADILSIVSRAEEALQIEVDIEAFFATPTLRAMLQGDQTSAVGGNLADSPHQVS